MLIFTVYVLGVYKISAAYASGKGFFLSGYCKDMNMIWHKAVSPNIKGPFLAVFAKGL